MQSLSDDWRPPSRASQTPVSLQNKSLHPELEQHYPIKPKLPGSKHRDHGADPQHTVRQHCRPNRQCIPHSSSKRSYCEQVNQSQIEQDPREEGTGDCRVAEGDSRHVAPGGRDATARRAIAVTAIARDSPSLVFRPLGIFAGSATGPNEHYGMLPVCPALPCVAHSKVLTANRSRQREVCRVPFFGHTSKFLPCAPLVHGKKKTLSNI